VEPLELEDLLLIAEAVLGAPAEGLLRAMRVGAAASALAAPFASHAGRDRHPLLADKAAILCSRLVRNHPLPDGNKRVALLAMLELVARNHGVWLPSSAEQEELAVAIEQLAAGRLSEAAFVAWTRVRVGHR
jgi:death-on-curing protein